MAQFFSIVSDALVGLLDITNQVIGIMIAWTILGVPLLFILATYDFLKTLLENLGIINDENEEPITTTPILESSVFGDVSAQDIEDALDNEKRKYVKRTKELVSPETEQRLLRKIKRRYGIIEQEE
jgi:hypothetical protein